MHFIIQSIKLSIITLVLVEHLNIYIFSIHFFYYVRPFVNTFAANLAFILQPAPLRVIYSQKKVTQRIIRFCSAPAVATVMAFVENFVVSLFRPFLYREQRPLKKYLVRVDVRPSLLSMSTDACAWMCAIALMWI